MFALVDANRFYASCHQIFRPDLRGQPVVVLSNNDGFVVARSPEAEALGIDNLQPFFRIEPQLSRHRVAIFSSHYPLYGDISQRLMTILRSFSPDAEIYSIDEMFLSLTSYPGDLSELGQRIRQTVWQQVRLPVSVGIAPTKTLAKLANRVAKRDPAQQGCALFDTPAQWDQWLRQLPVTAVWGIHHRLARRLAEVSVGTAHDLARADPKVIRQHTNVCVERTCAELNGHACLPLEAIPPARQQVYCTRSFGHSATDWQTVREGLTLYATRAAEKLRQQDRLATALHVFLHTSPFQPGYHAVSRVTSLPYPTSDTRTIVRTARQLAHAMYTPGHAWLKAGVGLIDLVTAFSLQRDLFHPGQSAKAHQLMTVMDAINRKKGRGTLFPAAQGISRSWVMRQQYPSPAYTTRWSDIPVVYA